MNNELLYLGISLGFNSSACLFSNKRGVLKSISEERLIRVKNTKEIPLNAIKFCLSDISKIDGICISHYEEITEDYFKAKSSYNFKGKSWEEFLRNYIFNGCKVKFDGNIYRVQHHAAHAMAPFAYYQKDKKFYIVTSDGFGDGASGCIVDEKMKLLSEKKMKNSVALIYQFVTGALGFKEHEHEGKITGLAAFGKPLFVNDLLIGFNYYDDADLYFDGDITEDEREQSKKSNIIDFDVFLAMKRTVYQSVNNIISNGGKREDIAASVQAIAERFTIGWLKKYCTDKKSVYLSGGLFANVKLNQKIKESGLFTNVYVCPPMGDEGTCVGACIYVTKQDTLGNFNNVFGGCYPTGKYFALDNTTIDYIVDELAKNKIVCLVNDKMEFGPRALCHRTILCDASDFKINDILNKKLGRTEFMPFAPVCCEEFAKDLFEDFEGGEKSAKFMTITYKGTNEFIENYKAVCHIDNTARPQCVNKDEMPFIHKILMRYYEKTEKKCLVNTSYNLHGEPIIDSFNNALKSFKKSKLDVLCVNNSIISSKEAEDEN